MAALKKINKTAVIIWRETASGIEVLAGNEGKFIEGTKQRFDINTPIARAYKDSRRGTKGFTEWKPANTIKQDGKLVPGWNQIEKADKTAGAAVTTIDEAWREFSLRAAVIQDQRKTPVHFVQITERRTPTFTVFETKFVYSSSAVGIIKGGCKGEEEPLACAKRELQEELLDFSFSTDIAELFKIEIDSDTNIIYGLELDSKESNRLGAHIALMRDNYYGEMFDFKFIPLDDLLKLELNMTSREALELFKKIKSSTSIGGSYKRKNHRRTRKRISCRRYRKQSTPSYRSRAP